MSVVIVLGIWYYFSPKYTDVGYAPIQPVPYSHKLHVDELKMDCRYCHSKVEVSAVSNIPSTQTCMNCHKIIKRKSEQLKLIQESWTKKKPVGWVRVHNLPGFVYFNHSVHLNTGVGCYSCHGDVSKMEVVEQKHPLSMAWCLDCHTNPDEHLRPVSEITKMDWKPPKNHEAFVKKVKSRADFNPTIDCSGCHR